MSNSQFFVHASPMTRPNGDDGQGNTDDGVPELVFTVFRNHFDEPGTVTVSYQITDGTAEVGTDYDGSADPLTGTLDFVTDYSQDPPRMDQWKAIRIALLDNQLASGDLTLICTLDESPTYRFGSLSFLSDTYTHTATGVIQDGTVYYISESGSSGNDGLTPANPKDAGSIEGLIVLQTSGGIGRAILLERGGEYPSSFSIDGSRKGGSIANPTIVGAWGVAGPNPVMVKDDPLFGYRNQSQYIEGTANTFQDVDLVGTATYSGRLMFIFQGQAGLPYYSRNITVLRSKNHHREADGYEPAESFMFYFQTTDLDNVPGSYDPATLDNDRAMFCEMTRSGGSGSGVGARGMQFVANYVHGNGWVSQDGVRDWATYHSHANPLLSFANRWENNVQGIKFRRCEGTPTQDSIVECNLLDGRGDVSTGNLMIALNSGKKGNPEFIQPNQYWRFARNKVYANPKGNLLRTSDADNASWAYKPEPPGAEFVLDGSRIVNNIFVIPADATAFSTSGLDFEEQQVRDLLCAHNTVICEGDTYGIQVLPYNNRYTNPSYGDDAEEAYTTMWAAEKNMMANIVISKVSFTIGCLFRYAGGLSVHSPYDEGCNPNVYVTTDGNHYSTADGLAAFRYISPNAQMDTLNDFRAAYTSGGELNSVESNPVLVRGINTVEATPLVPHVITPHVTHDYNNVPRGAISCAGAVHRGPAPVYAE